MASCDYMMSTSHMDKKDISQSMIVTMNDSIVQKNKLTPSSLDARNSRCEAALRDALVVVEGFDYDNCNGSKDASLECTRTTTVSTVLSSEDDTVVLPKVLSRCLPRLYRTDLIPLDLRFGIVREEDYFVTLGQANHKVIRQAIVKGPKARA